MNVVRGRNVVGVLTGGLIVGFIGNSVTTSSSSSGDEVGIGIGLLVVGCPLIGGLV